ncbi:MAG: methyltransferase [Pseudomonadota bacterium]
MDAEATVSHDTILGGRVRLAQPLQGYRAGVDAVLLAAACKATSGSSVLDLGLGVGAASLCLAARVPGLHLTGIEVQRREADLARQNGLDNGADLTVINVDLRHLPKEVRARSFDHVITNPPYFEPRTRVASARGPREIALAETVPLEEWIDLSVKRLRPKGTLTVVQKAARAHDLLRALDGRMGGVVLRPVIPREGRDAELVLVQGRKGVRAAFRLAAPLILHLGTEHLSDSEDYSEQASRILRDAAPLDL